VAKNTTTPVWNHEVNFAWMYPSVAQRFLILILTYELLQWKCVAEFELSLEEIAFKGESIWERKKQLLLPSIVVYEKLSL